MKMIGMKPRERPPFDLNNMAGQLAPMQMQNFAGVNPQQGQTNPQQITINLQQG